nr:antiviral reverse transcriptase Drt3b [uncultured Cohaesibacter sp.]
MPSGRKSQVTLDRADKWRVVLTDTSPFEVPIIVSNDGFYKNLHSTASKSANFKKMVNALVLEDDGKSYTVPLKYNVIRDSHSVRTLSLIHPKGQAILAEFYNKYEELICEYASRGPFSIRAPKKVGCSFFVPSSIEDKNQYKNATVDTLEVDKLVRNPASYFAYSGYPRLYLFFNSNDQIRLEKKFRFQLSLDISKCFDSIYTHSMAWATKSKQEAKENTGALSFGNQFDKVMQRLNHNETSGICIGPESSRIFAEIILAKVDQDARRSLAEKKNPIRDGIDYECKRYVDNYYVFTNDPNTAEHVEHELSIALREYNLHLNTEKRQLDKRPFYSKKSLVIDEINKSLGSHWEKLFDTKFSPINGKRLLHPKFIFKYRSLFGKFTREVKAACFASELGYDAVANYVIGAIRHKIIDISDSYEDLMELGESPFINRDYRQMLYFLLDVGFYFFTLHPTVSSSLRLSHAVVRAAQHLQKHDSDGFEILKEASLRWASQLAKAPSLEGLLAKNSVIPIEILNILISLQQFSGDGKLEHELLSLARLDRKSQGYFELVVRLFIYGNRSEFAIQRNEIWETISTRLDAEKFLKRDSESVHLLLDTLACPFLEKAKRAKLLRACWGKIIPNTGNINATEAESLVEEIQQQYWFVRWDGVNLLNMIEKKELSSVYA